ncbi:MAG: endonuclease, partial [Ignavibacteria bacterium]|nr:endonuclease [Ignavibacteria bacterium]
MGRDDGKTVGEYSAILYLSDRFCADEEGTFWFSETPEIPGSRNWGNSIPRICTWMRLVEKAS